MAKEEQSAISFDPATFSTGRWDGGRGVVVDDPAPRFEYRSFDSKNGKVTIIEAHLAIEDQEGNQHDAKWQAAYADNVVIRDGPGNDADEAEVGPSIAAREPGKKITLRADSEIGQLYASLQTQGYPSTKLGKGDLGVFVGLDADWVQYARKKDDKYPILVVGELFDGKSKGKASSAAGKSTKDEPVARKKKPSEEANDDARAEEEALDLALEALGEADAPTKDGTTVGDVVRLANKKLKADPNLKKLVLDLVGGDPDAKDSWITSQADNDSINGVPRAFRYKKKTNSIVLVED